MRRLHTSLLLPTTFRMALQSSPDEPAKSGFAVSASRISLVGLTAVRTRLGVRSPALADRLDEMARSVILRHLSPGDLFEPDGEGGYVVLFRKLNEREAEAKCQVLGSEIAQRFLDVDPSGAPGVETVLTQLPHHVVAGGEAHKAMLKAFAEGDGIVAWSSPPTSPQEAAAQRLGPVGQDTDARWGVESRQQASGSDVRWSVHPPSHAGSAGSAPVRATGTALIFAPVWDFEASSLIRFRLSPAASSPTAGSQGTDLQTFEQDLQALCDVSARLLGLAATKRRLALIWPVASASLADPAHQDGLLYALRQLSTDIRALLIVEVAAPSGRAMSATGQFAKRVAELNVALWTCSGLLAGNSGVPGVPGLKAAAVELHSGIGEAEAMAALTGFARHARQASVPSAAHGLNSRSMVIGAMAAGVRYISGPAVHPAVGDVTGLRFEAADLYRDHLRRGG